MTTTINYTEAAIMLGVHRESIANYVRRGLLTTSSTNSKAVTLQSVQNLINKHHEVLDITQEVQQMKEDLQKEKDHLSVLRQEVKDKIAYNKVKGITFQNLGYICDTLLVYLDSFGEKLSDREKKVVKALLAHTDISVLSDNIGLTDDRIRQIFHKALRRLANGQRAADCRAMNLALEEKIKNQDEMINDLRVTIEYYKEKLHIEKVMNGQEDEYVSVPKSWVSNIREVSLSVRSYNCLRSAGVEHVYELAFLSKYDFMRWRNFGRKSLNEIDLFKDQLGMPETRICDVTDINKIPNLDRIAIPLAVLENARRKWQKK